MRRLSIVTGALAAAVAASALLTPVAAVAAVNDTPMPGGDSNGVAPARIDSTRPMAAEGKTVVKPKHRVADIPDPATTDAQSVPVAKPTPSAPATKAPVAKSPATKGVGDSVAPVAHADSTATAARAYPDEKPTYTQAPPVARPAKPMSHPAAPAGYAEGPTPNTGANTGQARALPREVKPVAGPKAFAHKAKPVHANPYQPLNNDSAAPQAYRAPAQAGVPAQADQPLVHRARPVHAHRAATPCVAPGQAYRPLTPRPRPLHGSPDRSWMHAAPPADHTMKPPTSANQPADEYAGHAQKPSSVQHDPNAAAPSPARPAAPTQARPDENAGRPMAPEDQGFGGRY